MALLKYIALVASFTLLFIQISISAERELTEELIEALLQNRDAIENFPKAFPDDMGYIKDFKKESQRIQMGSNIGNKDKVENNVDNWQVNQAAVKDERKTEVENAQVKVDNQVADNDDRKTIVEKALLKLQDEVIKQLEAERMVKEQQAVEEMNELERQEKVVKQNTAVDLKDAQQMEPEKNEQAAEQMADERVWGRAEYIKDHQQDMEKQQHEQRLVGSEKLNQMEPEENEQAAEQMADEIKDHQQDMEQQQHEHRLAGSEKLNQQETNLQHEQHLATRAKAQEFYKAMRGETREVSNQQDHGAQVHGAADFKVQGKTALLHELLHLMQNSEVEGMAKESNDVQRQGIHAADHQQHYSAAHSRKASWK